MQLADSKASAAATDMYRIQRTLSSARTLPGATRPHMTVLGKTRVLPNSCKNCLEGSDRLHVAGQHSRSWVPWIEPDLARRSLV